MVIKDLQREAKSLLNDNAEFEANEIIMSVLEITRSDMILHSDRNITKTEYERVMDFVKRRNSGEPLQYILGMAEFMSLPFKVNGATLIPRSDTETLVEELISIIGDSSPKLIDIGTGTGCIGISLAKYTKAKVTLADISPEALETARENTKLNNTEADTLEIDILKNIPQGNFDIIVSNPPYIRTEVIGTLQTEVKDHEPVSALDGGSDGLVFYRRITEIAPQILSDNGILAYEIGFDQAADVKNLMEKNFSDIRIIKDLCGNDRVVIGIKKQM